MGRCFIFQAKECRNVSIGTRIRAAKFNWKLPIHSEDMDFKNFLRDFAGCW